MNKTITINIGGVVFNIEVDAYEKLENYLKEIKRHFTDAQGRDEIMADIESRIAEMFQEKVGKTKSVLITEDVERVINVMGNPEDYIEANDTKTENKTSFENLNFDNYNNRRRRVYRDGEDRVIGGVCSGIASYFNVDPLWIRLALAASFFFFGSGLLLYLILWIAIPEAKSTAEKLEMRGEKINVDNISKTIKDEFERVNESAKNFGNDARNAGGKFGSRARGFGNNAADFITSVVYAIIRFTGKFFAFFFIIFGVIILSIILGSLFGNFATIHLSNFDDVHSYSFREILLLLFNNESEISLATIGIFLLTAVPLLMLVYKGVRMILKVKNRNKIVSISASILFLIGIVISTYVFLGVANDFQMPAKQLQKVVLAMPSKGVLYIKTDKVEKYDFEDEDFNDNRNYRNTNRNNNLFKINESGITFSSPEFDVVPSHTDSFELVFIRTARGNTKKIAYDRASNINYKFSQTDSVLNLSNFFELNRIEKWRMQDLKIILRVPKGKTIFLNTSLENIIYDIDNVTNTHDSKMLNRRWIMNQEGLKCVDCKGIKDRRNIAVPPNAPIPPDLDEDIDDDEDTDI